MNRIESMNKKKFQETKERVEKDPSIFVAEIFGDQAPTERLFMKSTVDAIQFPYPDCELKYGWYVDYMCDLLWIDQPDFVMLVHDFDTILKENPVVKQRWINDLVEIILPWWDGEVVGHMVGGQPRKFNVFLEKEFESTGDAAVCSDKIPK